MEPIRKESLADAVSDRVLALIREGTYRAGDRLPTERELAGQLGVGRTSVREGLRYLEKLGVLDIHQGRGMMVRSLSLEDLFLNSLPVSAIVELPEKQIRDIMHARRVLELESARLAASVSGSPCDGASTRPATSSAHSPTCSWPWARVSC